MNRLHQNFRWMTRTVVALFLLAGCATTPPVKPDIEPVERDQIKAAIRRDIEPRMPGPPPFSLQTLPKTTELDLPETLYSMTLNDISLSTALQAIMRDVPLNLSVASDVDLTRTVTVHLKQATFDEAIDMVVKNGAGYAWAVEGDMLMIKTFMERIYALDYLDMPGETEIEVGGDMLASSVEDAGVSGKYVMKSSKKEKTADVWSAIEETLDTLKSEEGTVRINRNGGLIYMSDKPKRIDAMVRFLDALAEALSRQVFIEAKIMEVRLTDRNRLGIDWTSMDASFTSASGFFCRQFQHELQRRKHTDPGRSERIEHDSGFFYVPRGRFPSCPILTWP